MKANTIKLARDIMGNPWFVSEPEKMAALAMRFLERAPLSMEFEAEPLRELLENTAASGGKRKKCVVIPLHGTMTKYDTCENYGTQYLADKLKAYAKDKSVAGVVLDIDSGGGSSDAVPPLIEGIKAFQASGKPIYVHCDNCGSAAYWVASQCDSIYMDNKMSRVGSIGAYYLMLDDTAANPTTGERWITVYADESPDKNKAYREAIAGNETPAKEELASLVGMFREDVLAGRPSIKSKEKGVLTGAMFHTSDAIALGMADAMRTLDETIEAVFAISSVD